MDAQNIGLAGLVGGALLIPYNSRIGGGIVVIGVFLLAISTGSEKKEVKPEKPITNEETSIRIVGNNAYLIDANGKVIGINKLDEPKRTRGLLK